MYSIRKVNARRITQPVISPKIVESLSMRKCDKSIFQGDLKQIAWKAILDTFTHDPSRMVSNIQEIFNSVLNAS